MKTASPCKVTQSFTENSDGYRHSGAVTRPIMAGLLRRGEGGKLPPHGGWGEFSFTRGDFTKIILMRATVVRPKSGENK